MRESLFLLLVILIKNQINGQTMELVAGHVLFRHGDRTPITTYPTDSMKEKDWPNGYGQLTSTGVEQHHRLGQYLRTRYGAILNSTYIASELVVRSTDYDRTLMSVQSNLIGLYPRANLSDNQVPIQPIPVHTVPMNDDFLLAVNTCPRYDQLEHDVYQTDEFKEMNIYYQPFFQKLQQWTGIKNITAANAWDVADTIFIEHIYNKAPGWADDDVRKNLSNISDLSFHFLYLNDDTKRIRGGPVIQDMWSNMNSASRGNSYRKVKMYSAHDTTVSGALAFLRINYPHQPQYASALFVDLYKQNSSYFVKVEYLNVTDSKITYPYLLPGCPALECPFDIFTAIYQPRFPAKADVECANSTPPMPPGGDGYNKKLVVIISVVVIVLGIIIVGIFIFLHRRQVTHDPALLSEESSSQIA